MPRLLFYCILWVGLFAGYSGYGQCSCSGTYYYYDGDGDNAPANWQSSDRGIAYQDHIDSGCGEGSSGNVIYTCGSPPPNYTANSREDCNDNDRSVQRETAWYYDGDNDGAGDSNNLQSRCGSPGSGWVSSGGDQCPNDPNTTSGYTYFQDNDGDGVGGSAVRACTQGSYVTSGGDCDDNDALVTSQKTWYYDADEDGRGGSSTQEACTSPGGLYKEEGGDECDSVFGVFVKTTWYYEVTYQNC